MWRDVLGIESEIRPWTIEQASHAMTADRARDDLRHRMATRLRDPEYFLRLLFQSDSRTNEGGFSSAAFDELIERARQERSDRARLELFHEADRMAVAERVAVIPLVYGRSMAFVKPWVRGWWEFGKSSASFADSHDRPRVTASLTPTERGGSPSGCGSTTRRRLGAIVHAVIARAPRPTEVVDVARATSRTCVGLFLTRVEAGLSL